ncbi:MAG: peroxiredoxin [Draconibacterium sp.]
MKRFIIALIILVMAGNVFSQNQKALQIGDKAPSFKTMSDEGSLWDLKDYLGKKLIVVYFYPAAMTGGCTAQACSYRDHLPEIESANAIVVGISGDNVEGLKLFKKAENLNFALLSDETGEIAEKYGVPTKEGGSITREVDGQNFDLVRGKTASRWTFIIDKEGKIAYKNEQVDAAKDAEKVLEFIKNYSK